MVASAQRWLGLDVGSRSIKLVELERAAGGVRLLKSLIQELPVSDGAQPVDRVGWLQSALKEFEGHELHAAVGGSEAAIRRVAMPLMSKAELAEAVKWQIKDQLSFPVQDAVLDARVLGEVWEKDIKKQDVIVAAASAVSVRDLVTLIERAGGRVRSLLPTHAAMWRCVAALMPDAARGSVAVLDIGALETEVTIAKDGHIRLVRDVAIGSSSMTEALVSVVSSDRGEVSIDYAKAELFKRRYGVLAGDVEGTTEEGVPLFHLASLMRPVLENLLTELSRVLDFYKLQVDEAGVSRLLLCGGGAGLKQLQPFLADGLGVTVEVFNPLVRITQHAQSLEPEQVAEGGPRLGVAIGAALDHGDGFNLLPTELRRGAGAGALPSAWLTAVRWVGGLALAGYLVLQVAAGWLWLQVREQKQAWAGLEPGYTQCMTLVTQSKALGAMADEAQRFADQQPVWDGVFKALAAAAPETIQAEEMSVVPAPAGGSSMWRIRLKGHASAGRGGIAAFIEAMERSVFFSQVELTSSELRAGATDTTSFTIEGVLE